VLDPVYALNDAVVNNDAVSIMGIGKLYKPAPSPMNDPVNTDALTEVISKFP
jgi:hypothetical protein